MKLKLSGVLLVPGVMFFAVSCGPVQSAHPLAPSPQLTKSTAPAKPPVTTKSPPKRMTTKSPARLAITTATAPPAAQCTFRYAQGYTLPDPKCTPGSVQSTDVKAICTPGWATAHRQYFTKAEREVAFAKYGVHTTNPAGYGEYDHLIPLELGGSNNPDNLWPEKGSIPNAKDPIENSLHEAVCSGRVSLSAAQKAIAQDWPVAAIKVEGV